MFLKQWEKNQIHLLCVENRKHGYPDLCRGEGTRTYCGYNSTARCHHKNLAWELSWLCWDHSKKEWSQLGRQRSTFTSPPPPGARPVPRGSFSAHQQGESHITRRDNTHRPLDILRVTRPQEGLLYTPGSCCSPVLSNGASTWAWGPGSQHDLLGEVNMISVRSPKEI